MNQYIVTEFSHDAPRPLPDMVFIHNCSEKILRQYVENRILAYYESAHIWKPRAVLASPQLIDAVIKNGTMKWEFPGSPGSEFTIITAPAEMGKCMHELSPTEMTDLKDLIRNFKECCLTMQDGTKFDSSRLPPLEKSA